MYSHKIQDYIQEVLNTLPVFMDIEDNTIRKQLLHIFTTLILATKPFMLHDLKDSLHKVITTTIIYCNIGIQVDSWNKRG